MSTSLLLDELEQQLLPALLAEVQRDALLVARLHRPPERAALVARLAPVADRVGLARRLDLDDLGADVAEQAARERPGEQLAELDRRGRRRAARGRSRSRARRGARPDSRHSPSSFACQTPGVRPELRDEEVARLEHVLLHDQLGALGVAGCERARELAVVVRRDQLLLRRVPDVRPVDERQLDDTLRTICGEPLASRGVEDRVVEEDVLLHELV